MGPGLCRCLDSSQEMVLIFLKRILIFSKKRRKRNSKRIMRNGFSTINQRNKVKLNLKNTRLKLTTNKLPKIQ